MKKLIAMIGAVAMSFGLFAATTQSYTISFEEAESEKGVDTSTMLFTPPVNAGEWAWAGAPLPFTAYGEEPTFEYGTGAFARRDGMFDGENNLNYLPLETGTDELVRSMNGNIYLDQLVKFTGFEDPQTNLVEGTKIAIWMSEFENEDESTTTNLYVTVGKVDGEGKVEQVALEIDPIAGSDGYELNTWYRLSIKSLGDIMEDDSFCAGFLVYVNGQQVGSSDEVAKSLITNKDEMDGIAKGYMDKGQLFTAIDTEDATFTQVGYQGIGAIDDVIIDAEGPKFCQTIDVVIPTVVGAEVDYIDVNGTHMQPPISVPDGTTITVYFKPTEGKKLTGLDYVTQTITSEAFTIDVKDIVAEDVVATLTPAEGDATDLAQSELAAALAALEEGDVIAITADCSTDDYAFTPNTTLTGSADGLVIYIGNVDEDNGSLVINSGVAADFGLAVAFEENYEGMIAFAGDVEGTFVAANGTVEVTDDITLGAAATFKAATIDLDSDGTTISIVEGSKVMTTTDELTDEQILVPEDYELNVSDEDAEGYYTYTAKAVVPPASGFMVILAGQTEGQVYDTLADALDNVEDGATIKLLADVTDATGIVVDTKKSFTIDFDDHVYTVSKPGAGSTGTQTSAFQFIKGQTIVLKNGMIVAAKDNLIPAEVGKNIKRFIQSYADLTLVDMTLDGTNLYLNPTENAMCEFANGEVSIEGDTSIIANKANLDAISIDTWKGRYPDGVSVTIDTTGTISSVKVWTEGTGDFTPGEVALEGGTITELKVDGNDADYEIANTGATVTTTPAGYFWDNGVLAKCAAEINGTYYNTLAAAFAAAEDNDVIVLLKDVTIAAPIKVANKVTLNIGDFDITPAAKFTRPDGSKDTIDAMFVVRYGGDFTVLGGEGVIDCSEFPTIYSPIKLTEFGETFDEARAKVTVNANLKGYYYGITGNGGRPGTDIVINGGVIEGANANDSAGIYNPQGNSTITVNAGTVQGASGIGLKSGVCTVEIGSEAIIKGVGAKAAYKPKSSGITITGDALILDNTGYPGGVPNAVIAGGTFISENGAAVASYANEGKGYKPIVGFVTGGTFQGQVAPDPALAGGGMAFPTFVPGEAQTLVPAVASVNDVNYGTSAAALAAVQALEAAKDFPIVATALVADLAVVGPNGVTIVLAKDETITINANSWVFSGGATISDGPIALAAGATFTVVGQIANYKTLFSAPADYEVVEIDNKDGTFTYSAAQSAAKVAKIGNVEYPTLADAVAAAALAGEAVKIELLANVTENVAISGVEGELDLGDFTLTSTISVTDSTLTISNGTIDYTADGGTFTVAADAEVTVAAGATITGTGSAEPVAVSGTLNVYGTVESLKSQTIAILVNNGATVNCYDGSVVTAELSAFKPKCENGKSYINIYGGTFTASKPSQADMYGVFYGSKTGDTTEIKIVGGSFNVLSGGYEMFYGCGSMIFKDADGNVGLDDTCTATFNINPICNSSYSKVTPAQLYKTGYTAVQSEEDGLWRIAKVYNVTFDAAVENGTLETSVTNGIVAGTTVEVFATPDEGFACTEITTNGEAIVGTTFVMPEDDVEISATFAEIPKIAQIGSTTYPTLGDAIAALTGTGDETIELLKDYTVGTTEAIQFSKSATLDLGGFTLSVPEANLGKETEKPAFAVLANAEVTLNNGTIALGYDLEYIEPAVTKEEKDHNNGCGYGIQVRGIVNANCTITRKGYASPIFDIYGGSDATVNVLSGADITSTADVFRHKKTVDKASVFVTGGTIKTIGTGNYGIFNGSQYMHDDDVAVITGGTFLGRFEQTEKWGSMTPFDDAAAAARFDTTAKATAAVHLAAGYEFVDAGDDLWKVAKIPSFDVTFTKNTTEELGSTNVLRGTALTADMIPAVEGGEWDVDPVGAVITCNTNFNYTVKAGPDWPEDWPKDVPDAMKEAFKTWAETYGVSTFEGAENAFLMNEDPKAGTVTALEITSIEVADGVATIKVAAGEKNLETGINGKLFVSATDDLAGEWKTIVVEEPDSFEDEGLTAVFKVEGAQFMKAKVGFKVEEVEKQ